MGSPSKFQAYRMDQLPYAANERPFSQGNAFYRSPVKESYMV